MRRVLTRRTLAPPTPVRTQHAPRPRRLDPGINIVVKEIACTLTLAYNVRRAWGVRFGWRGFTDPAAKEWLELTQERVANIHKEGGSILGCRSAPLCSCPHGVSRHPVG